MKTFNFWTATIFTGKGVVTGVSTVVNGYTAAANAVANTKLGSQVNSASGIKGSWSLGEQYSNDLTNWLIDTVTFDTDDKKDTKDFNPREVFEEATK